MRPETARELLVNWIPNLTTLALIILIRLLQSGDPRLIRHAYHDDDGNGCLAEWAGRHHPALAGRNEPGIDFLSFVNSGGYSFVVEEWDHDDPEFTSELLEMLRNELRLRTPKTPARRTGSWTTSSTSSSC